MASIMRLHLSMQEEEEEVLEHTNAECHLCTFYVNL